MKQFIPFLLIVICFSVPLNLQAQQQYLTRNGIITFDSKLNSFVPVKAENSSVSAILNVDGGEIAVLALVKGFSFKNLILSASIWLFAFTGYSRLATFGEEVDGPEKIIPKAILVGLGITLFLYVSTSFVTLGIVNPSIIENSLTPLKVAFDLSRFSEFSYLIIIASTVATGSVLLALLPGISRVLVAMARDKKIPSLFMTIHPKQNSAYVADIFVGFIVVVGILNFDVLSAVKLSAIFILIYYSITNLCVIRLEKSKRIFPIYISAYGLLLCVILGIFLVIYF